MGFLNKFISFSTKVNRLNPLHKAADDYVTKKFFDGNIDKRMETKTGVLVVVADIIGGIFGYPGAGSLLSGANQVQDKNYKGAVLSFASAGLQIGSSPNVSGYTNTANAVTPAAAASASVASDASLVAFDAGSDYTAAFGPNKTVVGSGIYGYTGEVGSTVSGIPSGTYTVGTGGGIGIDFATASANNIPNLTLKDLKSGAGFVKTAVGMYDLINRDGSVRATYGIGAQQVPNESINYQFSAPSNMWAIPSNRAQDLAASNQVAQAMADQAQQQKMIVLALGCGAALYLLGAFK